MPQINATVHSDLKMSFTRHPITGRLSNVTNIEAVKQSVKNIVLCNNFERPYMPNYGGNVLAQLFENADSFTEYQVSKDIRLAIDNYEPRAIVDDIIVSTDDLNELRVKIIFRMRNVQKPIELIVMVERVR
jgi:phage baseplate assembly protein W